MRSTGSRLAGFAAAVVVCHHIGVIAKPLGDVGSTRWADWVDLALVPAAVLGLAAATLLAAGAGRRDWMTFAVGAVLYAEGHGIHLAANSINNTEPTGRVEDAAHLWDEVVSHYVFYVGETLVVVALAMVVLRVGQQVTIGAYPLALLFGLTWTTNSIEGGTAVFGLAVALGLSAWGWQRRPQAAGRLLLVAYGTSLLLIAGWGVWHGGFPQFSELGWI